MSKLKYAALATALTGGLAAIYFALSPRYAPNAVYHNRIFKSNEPNPCRLDLIHAHPHGDKRRVEIPTEGGHTMHGWLFRNKRSRELLIYCMGRTSNVSNNLDNVEMLVVAGYSVCIFEYRGFGLSPGGPPSVESICEDGIRAFDFAVEELGYSPSHITVYGESLGAAVAANLTKHRGFAGLILQSGFASLRRIGQHMMPLLKVYPRALYPDQDLDTEQTLSNGDHPPLLILHGRKDEVIPYSHAEVLFQAAAGRKTLVELPNSMHRFIRDTDQNTYISAVRRFRKSIAFPAWKRKACA